jgi:TRAP-type C4-dicarboxylate transport system substrate-binding protein
MRKLLAAMLVMVVLVGSVLVAACSDESATPTPAPTTGPTTAPTTAPTPTFEPMTLKVASHLLPATRGWWAMERVCESIEARTDGLLSFDYYPTQSLIKATETWHALATSVIDMAPVWGGYHTGEEPMLAITGLPLQYSDKQHYWSAFKAGQQDLLDSIFEQNDIKLLTTGAEGEKVTFWTTSEVHVPDDLKGLKIRSGSPIWSAVAEAGGASVVKMPSSEYYLALQLGTIDGVMTGLLSGTGRALQEVVDYGIDLAGALDIAAYVPAMSLDTWKKLTPDLQAIVMDEFDKYHWIIQEEYAQEYAEAYGMYIDHGVEIYTPTDEEMALWLANIRPVTENWVSELESAADRDLAEEWLAISDSTRP